MNKLTSKTEIENILLHHAYFITWKLGYDNYSLNYRIRNVFMNPIMVDSFVFPPTLKKQSDKDYETFVVWKLRRELDSIESNISEFFIPVIVDFESILNANTQQEQIKMINEHKCLLETVLESFFKKMDR